MNISSTFWVAVLISALLLVGCSSESSNQQKNDVVLGKLVLSDGWARPGTKGQTSGVYMKIDNGTATQDTLLSVTSNIAGRAEIHESYKNKNDVMGMRPAGQQIIADGGELMLEPGGLHIMLIDLKQDLAVGDSVNISLEFSRVGTRSITVPVQIQK